jgi:hypothetical protein
LCHCIRHACLLSTSGDAAYEVSSPQHYIDAGCAQSLQRRYSEEHRQENIKAGPTTCIRETYRNVECRGSWQ